MRTRALALASALAALGLLLTGCGTTSTGDGSPVANVSVQPHSGFNGIVLPKPYDVAHVPLTDTSGSSYALDTEATKPVTLVFFGYTNCPDVCKVVMANIASAMTRLDPAQRAKVGLVFVTTDPARDNRQVLRRYLDRFDPSFQGLTGPLPRITALGKSMGIFIQKGARLPSGGYEVTHGTQVIGLLPDHKAPVVWTEGTSPSALAADLQTILAHGVPKAGRQ